MTDHKPDYALPEITLTEAENRFVNVVWGSWPGRDRLAVEKRNLERIIAGRVAEARVAALDEAIRAINEIGFPEYPGEMQYPAGLEDARHHCAAVVAVLRDGDES